MNKFLSAGVACALLWLLPAPAAAQVYVPPPPATYNQWGFHHTRMGIVRRSVARRSGGRRAGAPGKSAPTSGPRTGGRTTKPPPTGGRPATPSPAGGATTFRPVGKSVLPPQLARNLGKTPAERADLEQFFAGMLGAYQDMLREKGVAPNDVARAASFAIANSYSVYHDGQELSGRQMEGLRAQMREAFAEDDEFQRLDDRQRQELYEGYAIMGMYVLSMHDAAVRAGDRGLIAKIHTLARTQLDETFGVPADRLRFTDAGIEF